MYTKNCDLCGAEIPSDLKFCNRCGATQKSTYPQRSSQGGAKSPLPKIIIAVVVLVFVLSGAGVGALLLINRGGPNIPATLVTQSTPTPAPAVNTPPPAQPQPTPEITPAPAVQGAALTPAQIFDINKDAVFQIRWHSSDGLYNYTHWGSGFFISPTGVAVTNHHVMEGAQSARVILFGGAEYEITGYYSYDIGNDLAIIQVGDGNNNFSSVTMGDSNGVRIGDYAYALGGPGGDDITFTDGIISRIVSDEIMYSSENVMYSISGLLQTTASIYGGNSGGPLLNERGEVIGINSAGSSERESQQWAVPINRVDVPAAGAAVLSLPIGAHTVIQRGGGVTFLKQYPFIPDILSVSSNAVLLGGGAVEHMGFAGLFRSYDFDNAYIYQLSEQHFIPDTDAYDVVLTQNGFIMQNIVVEDGVTYVYLFNARENTSLLYLFVWDENFLTILIGSGDAYAQIN